MYAVPGKRAKIAGQSSMTQMNDILQKHIAPIEDNSDSETEPTGTKRVVATTAPNQALVSETSMMEQFFNKPLMDMFDSKPEYKPPANSDVLERKFPFTLYPHITGMVFAGFHYALSPLANAQIPYMGFTFQTPIHCYLHETARNLRMEPEAKSVTEAITYKC